MPIQKNLPGRFHSIEMYKIGVHSYGMQALLRVNIFSTERYSLSEIKIRHHNPLLLLMYQQIHIPLGMIRSVEKKFPCSTRIPSGMHPKQIHYGKYIHTNSHSHRICGAK